MAKRPEFNFFQLALLTLAPLCLLLLLVNSTNDLPSEVGQVIQLADLTICAVFFFEFWYELYKAPSKIQYLKWGWLDLLASIPMIDSARALWLVRLLRVIRVIRLIRLSYKLSSVIFYYCKHHVLKFVVLTEIILLLCGSLSILALESDVGNITTAHDAIWWTFNTLVAPDRTTFYPVTIGGKVLSGVLVICRLIGYSLMVGQIVAWFIHIREQEEQEVDR